jgi:3-oxoacyl-[acyl-carrier protein] reductase
MSQDFAGQLVVVTGGTRGIGQGISKKFLECGATVIATYRSNQLSAENFKSALENEGHEKLIIRQVDVDDSTSVTNFFHYLTETHGSFQVLINNAGIRKDNVGALMTDDDFDSVIRTNLRGSFLMSRESIKVFMGNRYGRIVNISSVGGRLSLPGQCNYAATKAGVLAMSGSLSKEVAKKGITINSVAPGFIDTDFFDDIPADQIKDYKKTVPMKRFGSVEEVAHAVLSLAHKNASYITGACLEVGGGL